MWTGYSVACIVFVFIQVTIDKRNKERQVLGTPYMEVDQGLEICGVCVNSSIV